MRRVFMLFCIAFIVFPCFCAAAGKLETDPNTPQKRVSSTESAETVDVRLDQNVTYQTKRKTIVLILDDLQKMTGIDLKAGYNDQDWQVRDRKMTIYTKDLPLRSLMASIARVMKFKWVRKGDEKAWTYCLQADKSLVKGEEEAYRQEEKFKREQAARREDVLNDLAASAKASDKQLDGLKKDNPYVYFMSKAGLAGPLSELMNESPVLKNTFVNGEEYESTSLDLSPAAQDALKRIRISWIKLESAGEQDSKNLSHATLMDPARLTASVGKKLEDEESIFAEFPMIRKFLLGNITIGYPLPSDDPKYVVYENADIPVPDPKTQIGKGLGEMFLQVLNAASTGEKPGQASFSFTLKPEEFEQRDFGEPAVKHTEDPDLKKEIELNVKKLSSVAEPENLGRLDALLIVLGEASGLNVVAESSGQQVINMNWPPKTTIKSMLDFISMGYMYNWWKQDSTLEFRNRYWFRQRSLQIPEKWLEKWRKTLKETGTLDIDDMADMAKLIGTAASYQVNIAGDEILDNPSVKSAACTHVGVLAFYGSLDKRNKAAVFSQNGLDLKTLPSDMLLSLKDMVSNWNRESDMRIKCTRTKTDQGTTEYTFEVLNDSARTTCLIRSPKYLKTGSHPIY